MNYIWHEWSNSVVLLVAKQTFEYCLQMVRKKFIVIPVNEIGFGNLARSLPHNGLSDR